MKFNNKIIRININERIFIIIFILNCLLPLLKAQNGQSEFVKIANPAVNSFLKFVDFPVDLFTGSADVSIPLCTVNDGEINLPITIRYNTSGIKVNEEASWVGLGWNLNVGGVISQSVVGKLDNDMYYSQFLERNIWPANTSTLINLPKTTSLNGCFMGKVICSEDNYEEMNRIIDGEYMPDVYYFSFFNQSGKFFINPADNNIYQVKKEQNIKFQKLSVQQGGGWIVTLENGTKLRFDDKMYVYEGSRIASINYYLTNIIYPNGQAVSFGYKVEEYYSQPYTGSSLRIPKGGNVISSELVPHIYNYEMINKQCSFIETNNFKIEFKTSERQDLKKYSERDKPMKLDSIIIINKQNTSYNRKFKFYNSYFVTSSPYGVYAGGISDSQIKRLKLDSIGEVGVNAKYRFNYNSVPLPIKSSFAQDYWGYYNGQTNNTTIIPNYAYMHVKGVDMRLTTQWAGANRAYDFDYCKAAILESVIYPTGGKVTYSYEPHTFSGQIIPTVSEIDDIYNRPLTLLSELHDINWSTGDKLYENFPQTQNKKVRITIKFSRGSYTWYELSGANVNLSAYGIQAKTWQPLTTSTESIQTIVEEFDLAPTLYNYLFTVNMPDPGNLGLGQASVTAKLEYLPDPSPLINRNYSYGAGLRVNEITAYDYNGTPILKKAYQFDDISAEKIYGELSNPLSFYRDIWAVSYRYCTNAGLSDIKQDETILSSSNQYSFPYSSANGNVGYSKASLKSVTLNGSQIQDIGITLNEYTTGAIQVTPEKGIPGFLNPMYGSLKKTTYLDNSKNVKKVEEFQIESLVNVARGAAGENKLNIMSQSMGGQIPCDNDTEHMLQTHTKFYHMYVGFYPILFYELLLKQKTTTIDGVQIVENNTYNSFGQLASRSTSNSDSSTQMEKYNYVSDYSGSDPVLTKMKDNHWISPVTHIEKKVDNRLVYQEDNEFSSWYSDFYSLDFFNLSNKKIYPSGDLSNYNSIKIDNYIYNNISNVGMVQKLKDKPVSYYWGYNETSPVIKAENLSHDNLSSIVLQSLEGTGFTSFETLLTKISSFPNSAWTIFNNNLRKNAPNALITTYTYIPLVGMTSQTDPNGVTTYYEYDAFARLKCMKDDEGRILKTYDYHYKQ